MCSSLGKEDDTQFDASGSLDFESASRPSFSVASLSLSFSCLGCWWTSKSKPRMAPIVEQPVFALFGFVFRGLPLARVWP